MKWIAYLWIVLLAVVCVVAAQAPASRAADGAVAAIAKGELPRGYRDWRLISVAREEGELDDIGAILGVQFMVKDSEKHASTGGWSYAQFDDGKLLRDAATLQRCFECHQAVKERDYVFTRYAP